MNDATPNAAAVESATRAAPPTGMTEHPPAAIFGQLATTSSGTSAPHDIDLVLDIPVQLSVELGRTKMPIRQILSLAQGSIVELDGLAGEPMDVLVNGCLIAQGEVVVVANERFGIRLTGIVTPAERVRKLKR